MAYRSRVALLLSPGVTASIVATATATPAQLLEDPDQRQQGVGVIRPLQAERHATPMGVSYITGGGQSRCSRRTFKMRSWGLSPHG